MGTNILPAATLSDKSDSEAERLVEDVNGFAQIFPELKFHIVELLQGKQHIVGMTGDGVNDAPALKKADAGIAVAGATDVARSAADIVFTLPGLFVIIDAIKESRKIFLQMVVMGHLTIFLTRTRGHFWSIKPCGALLWSAVITKKNFEKPP